MATPNQDKTAAGCLALFALPFAAIGVVCLYFVVSALLTWQSMSAWVAVPATLDRLELEEHDSDDGTSYEVAATYRYRYDGREYTSDRVAIIGFADNIGDFQHDLYATLAAARSRGAPVTAYVDPENPADATLNRDMRWLFVVFLTIFALVFGGAGFGLLIGSRAGLKKIGEERERQSRFPDEPWRWRSDWADGYSKGSHRAIAYASLGFALFWNLVSLPVVFVVPREVSAGNWPVLVALLFPLVGIGLAAWAIRAWRQLRRFRGSTLALARVPAALGGRLRGTVRVEAEVPVATQFRVELTCVKHDRGRGGRNEDSIERLLWQGEFTVPRVACQIASTGTSIPIDVPMPTDQPVTSMLDDDDRVSWRLDVSGECPGPDYWCRFEVPVFDLGVPREDEPVAAHAAPSATAERPDRRRLEALGIAYQQLPSGEAWTFRRAQHKKVAAGLTALCTVWTAIAAWLLWSDAPLLFPIVFGLFDLIFVWWMLTLWLTEYRVTLDDRMLTLAKRGFGAGAPVEIPRVMVRGVRAQRGMQAGNKLYYDLRVETEEKTHTAAGSVADYSVAAWLADYWLRGRSEPAR